MKLWLELLVRQLDERRLLACLPLGLQTDNDYATYWTKSGLTICYDEPDSQELRMAGDMWMGDMVHNGTTKTHE